MARRALVLVLLTACQHQPPAPGTERADCRPDKSCDPGLVCLSSTCVQAPPADCPAIGELLASFDLGNYAEPEDRKPVVDRYRAACEHLHLTKEEGACLDKTRDKWAAAQCAPRLFPEQAASGTDDCSQVRAKIRASYGAQAASFQTDPRMTKWFDMTMQVVQQSCEQDRWPAAVKTCILGSDPGNANTLATCNQTMPAPLQQKLQDRMTAAMRALQP